MGMTSERFVLLVSLDERARKEHSDAKTIAQIGQLANARGPGQGTYFVSSKKNPLDETPPKDYDLMLTPRTPKEVSTWERLANAITKFTGNTAVVQYI